MPLQVNSGREIKCEKTTVIAIIAINWHENRDWMYEKT
jgi:hypothetical protein